MMIQEPGVDPSPRELEEQSNGGEDSRDVNAKTMDVFYPGVNKRRQY
jgi:hypothetical protein